jgi:hypothetical protein
MQPEERLSFADDFIVQIDPIDPETHLVSSAYFGIRLIIRWHPPLREPSGREWRRRETWDSGSLFVLVMPPDGSA